MKLIFEKSVPGRGCDLLPECDVPVKEAAASFKRETAPKLPEIAEVDIGRHYTELIKRTHGMNNGFYPLGSCTMKYNPRINEEMAALAGFTGIHPLQPESTVQGCLEAMNLLQKYLCEITGMNAITLQPAAGAHGEFTGLLLIKAYHESRNDTARTKIIVPDSAHGTNPASAVMAGFSVVNIKSDENGLVDLNELKAAVGDDTAGLMLTNPNTVGIFDNNILEITKIVHEAGGLVYYDGANLNAIMGTARPGDMGFDVVHLNLHKTFSTPHGGGGPGSGPVGCKDFLAKFLPGLNAAQGENGFELKRAESSIGNVKAFYGNFLVTVKALTYILTLGAKGIKEASQNAVLNANYLMKKVSCCYDMAYNRTCMHEFVMTLENMKRDCGVSAMDIAKMLQDYGLHPPTMYFPLIVHEALMVEPTETESKDTLDKAAEAFISIYEKAKADPEWAHSAPHFSAIKRPDEVTAARTPVLRYSF